MKKRSLLLILIVWKGISRGGRWAFSLILNGLSAVLRLMKVVLPVKSLMAVNRGLEITQFFYESRRLSSIIQRLRVNFHGGKWRVKRLRKNKLHNGRRVTVPGYTPVTSSYYHKVLWRRCAMHGKRKFNCDLWFPVIYLGYYT